VIITIDIFSLIKSMENWPYPWKMSATTDGSSNTSVVRVIVTMRVIFYRREIKRQMDRPTVLWNIHTFYLPCFRLKTACAAAAAARTRREKRARLRHGLNIWIALTTATRFERDRKTNAASTWPPSIYLSRNRQTAGEFNRRARHVRYGSSALWRITRVAVAISSREIT